MPAIHQQQEARISQREAVRIYDRLAKSYDLWARLTESKARRIALREAHLEDGQRVLEVAVGTGIAFLELARSNSKGLTVGLDLSEGMLARTRARLRDADISRADLLRATAFAIPARSETFDLVLNCYMFDLLASHDWGGVVEEFRRVLRPGGRLLLVNMTIGRRFGSGIYERIFRWSPRLGGGCRGVHLGPTLREHGFEVERRGYVQQMLFPSEVVVARRADRA